MKLFLPPHLMRGAINWLLLASLAFLVIPAQAATFTVTNLTNSGPGSLRQAVSDANATAITDTIVFQAGLTGTITLTSGEIGITSRLTIAGPGETVLEISGKNASRVFNVNSAGATISGLTIANGKSDNGGAINNTALLTLSHVSLLDNNATAGGGALYNKGTLTATYLTIENNSSSGVDVGGGGIYNAEAGNLTLSNSTIAYNRAIGGTGGGILSVGVGTKLTILNSTISDNNAVAAGGGIFSISTLIVSNSTITGNFVAFGGEGFAVGGGIGITWGGTLSIGNSIVAGNFATSDYAPNSQNIFVWDDCCTSTVTSQGFNLFGENGASGVHDYNSAEILKTTDIILDGVLNTAVANLDDNGGPTKTQALVAGSPAINAGDNSLIPAGVTTDQRGFARMVGTKVDIGAVEYGAGVTNYALTLTKTGTGTGTVTSAPAGINCSATCSANFTANANVILVAAATTGSAFASWSGVCTGAATSCTVTMSAAKAVTATFNLDGAISLPTATTNAASNVTATSAVLNGQVNSNGATATISFDFGLTTAYGTSISAVPSTVYGNANVAASKPGLTCGVTYHYRVKAVNSKGTSYGADRAFTTVACAVTRKWPDFVITSLTLTPATPVANGTFSLAVVVKNQGLRSGDGGFLDVWANQAAVPTCGAAGNKYADVGFMAAGASKTFTVTGLNAGTAGAKTARAYVDSWCEIVESNETNNQLIKMYTVP